MFRRRRKDPDATKSAKPADVFLGLRNQLLNLDPDTIGLRQIVPDGAAWGCVMETGYPNGTATLVCLGDGTTSLYTSSGFGIIGAGANPTVVQENAKLRAVLNDHLADMSKSSDQSLPGEGRTIIRALTFEGQLLYEAAEVELGEGRSVLSPVFHAAHRVITQLRLIHEDNR